MSNEKIISITTSTDKSAAKTIYDNASIKVRFNGDLLRQNQITYNRGPVKNIYVVYRRTPDTKIFNIALENCLFGAVMLTKNADVDKYKYSGYSVHANNKVNNVIVRGKDFIQGINGTTIYTEKMYSPNFTVDNKTY